MSKNSKTYCRSIAAVISPSAKPALAALLLGLVAISGTKMTPARAVQSVDRPLSDFIGAQGTTTCFTPPAPSQLGGSSALNKPPVRFALADYTGLTAEYLSANFDISLGTTVSGTVSERPLADGRALVTVNLHTRDALTWAINFDPSAPASQFNNNPLLFGSRAQDLIADPTLTPALADVHLRAVFTIPAPGAPLPDLVCINQGPDCPNVAPCPEGFEIDFLTFQANAEGPLHALAGLGPEGTPGRLTMTQIGLIKPAINNGFKGALADAFPVEKIELRATGR